MALSGTDNVWTTLERLPHEEVCRKADVRFEPSTGSYALSCFGHEVLVCPAKREISSSSPAISILVKRLRYFSELSILWYLVDAKEVPLSGKLIRPSDLKAGQIFATGSHVLPLDKLAQKYGDDMDAFIERGSSLSGKSAGIGDASLRLLPFPRVPVFIVLWRGCEEFQARADLLFDSTCECHFPQDIVWATAMSSILILM
jgi:hypothetical protein